MRRPHPLEFSKVVVWRDENGDYVDMVELMERVVAELDSIAFWYGWREHYLRAAALIAARDVIAADAEAEIDRRKQARVRAWADARSNQSGNPAGHTQKETQ